MGKLHKNLRLSAYPELTHTTVSSYGGMLTEQNLNDAIKAMRAEANNGFSIPWGLSQSYVCSFQRLTGNNQPLYKPSKPRKSKR
jgi:hypothetical protein